MCTNLNVKKETTPLVDFEELFNAAPDAIILVNKRGKIILANRQVESLLGYAPDELVGKTLDILLPERFREMHQRFLATFFKQPIVRLMGSGKELYGLRKDGKEFDIDISLSPIETSKGVMITAAMRDISHRKKLERELVETNIQLNNFTGSVAHDLQAPLNAIIGFSDLLSQTVGNKLSERDLELFHTIERSAQNMSSLIKDLLTYSRTNGKEGLILDNVDLNEIIERVFSDLEAKEKDVKISKDDLPTIRCNRSMTTQLFQNLIGNAIKYNRSPSPEVHIGVEEREDSWYFTIKDNGIGIDPRFYTRLFEPFKRGNHKEFSGTGLGLSICKRVVEVHGGKISVESQLGEGSIFMFSFNKLDSDEFSGPKRY